IGEHERIPGQYFLINYIKVSDEMYFGAIVTLADIHELLLIQWNDGDIGSSSIYRTESQESFKMQMQAILTEVLVSSNQAEAEEAKNNEKGYVIMDQYSNVVNIAYRLVIPEKTIMRELLFFRNATLVAPIFFLAI